LSVVIPCFNESAVLPLLHERLRTVLSTLGPTWEVLLVDDGSTDDTWRQLAEFNRRDGRFKAVGLSRNFGHQTAVAAGLAHAQGDVVAVLDADLQDPPELLGECLECWRDGDDVVYLVRQKRKEGLLKRALYSTFYRLLDHFSAVRVPRDSGDFSLMDRRVVDVVVSMPERHLFLRGMRAWAGFRQHALPYERPARAAGDTKYPLVKLVGLAADGLFSFSIIPLRLATWFGLLSVLAASAWGLFVLVWRILGFSFLGHTASELPGWTGGVLLAILFGSIQLMFLGVLGEYVGRIYEETKGRPRWVVRSLHGLPGADRS
ncbi:MAG: glycosyltransferase family 2 protein, partial [Acidobacteria bacterium]|nr:glycosyltransferase family 2 protein [Acidobacteriota bacterium]